MPINYSTSDKTRKDVISTLEIYPDMMRLKTPQEKKKGGGERGECKGFSPASRRRMIAKMAELHLSDKHVYFVTLTYPGIFADSWEIWKRDVDVFRKWFQRAFNVIGVVWRIEFQKRGAPHYHLICVFDEKQKFMQLVKKIGKKWAEIVRSGYLMSGGDKEAYKPHYKHNIKAGTNVQEVKGGRRQLMAYVAKYAAKPQDIGVKAPEKYGRAWGVWNLNGYLDFSCDQEIELEYDQAVVLRRMIRRYFKSKGNKRMEGRMRVNASFAVLGLGSESNRTAYKLAGAVAGGLFEAHIPPHGFSGGSMRFLDRVRAGQYGQKWTIEVGSKVRLKEDGREGIVQDVRYCAITKRWRYVVDMEYRDRNGKRRAYFDAWDIELLQKHTYQQVQLLQVEDTYVFI